MPTFSEVLVVSTHREPTPIEDVRDLERQLGVTMPQGWVDFVTTFGQGTYCDLFRIYTPSQILDQIEMHHEIWAMVYECLESPEEFISRRDLAGAIPIGDTLDGDELLFNPSDPGRILLLPRDADRITALRTDLEDLPGWNCQVPRKLTFQTHARQAYMDFRTFEFLLTADQLLDEIRSRWSPFEVTYRTSDAWSWGFVGFAPAIGARIQAVEDEDVTRTVGITTSQGSGRRWLWLQVACDDDEVRSIVSFLGSLRERGLAEFEDRTDLAG